MKLQFESTVLAAIIASITTLVGFFLNDFFQRRSARRRQLKSQYAEIIVQSRSIRRTLLTFYEFNIAFMGMLHTIKDGWQENETELDIQIQSAFNYESLTNKYKDLLNEQQNKLDAAFFMLAGMGKNHKIPTWQDGSTYAEDVELQEAIERVLTYKKSHDNFDEAKDSINLYFRRPLAIIQDICTARMRVL
jgi:hypothetical protein